MSRKTTPKTPALSELWERGIPHTLFQYEHHPDASSFGREAAEKLDLEAERIFKTLVIALDSSELAVCIIPVTERLSMKKAAACFGCKKAELADPRQVERSTGYILGGVSPIGQKKVLRSALDETAFLWDSILVSAGRRGLDVGLSPDGLRELSSALVCDLTC